jgi:hypothetical protein
MGNILCGATNNVQNNELIVKEALAIKEDVKEEVKEEVIEEIKEEVIEEIKEVKEEIPVLIEDLIIKEEEIPVLIEDLIIKEEEIPVLIEEPIIEKEEVTLDELVESESLSRNDITIVSTTDNVEEPVKKKRGRKKKAALVE